MKSALARFTEDENGAVTVEWVVLCAALVGLVIASMNVVATNTGTVITSVGDRINERNVE